MSTDTYQHTFNWKGHGNTVVATGSFDDWKTSLPPLNKQADGTFSGQIGVPFGQKIVYKYVVDGQWMHNMDEQTETDSSGNVNNVFNVPERSEIPAPASTDAVLPVPESVSTVSGDVSSNEPATTNVVTSTPSTTESSAAEVQQKATELAGQAQQSASETAGQVQQKTSETVQAGKEKMDEIVPQVKESLSNAAQTTKENAGPAAAAVATGAAAVVAAGVATVIGATGSSNDKEVTTEKTGSITPTRSLSASASPFVPGGEKPQDPSPTPSPITNRSAQESIPTIPSNSFIDAKVPEEDKAHTTAVVPKETTSSTSAAPVYDEKTAVVAKDDNSAPTSISTPLGNTAQASTEVAKSEDEDKKKDVEALPQPEHVEGLVAPAENPSDKPLFAAGAAALGAAVAGVTLLGEKAYHAALPHAQNAAETVSEQTSKALNTASEQTSKAVEQAPQTASNAYNSAAQSASNAYNSAAQSTSNALDTASKSTTQAANSASETASSGYQQATESAGGYLESAKAGAGKGLEAVQNTAIGGAVLGAVGLGGYAATKKEEVSTGIPNKDITPLPVSEAPVAPASSSTTEKGLIPAETSARPSSEAPTLPDKEISPLPASEAPVASTSGPSSSTSSAPLPVPKEPSAPLPVAKDSAPVDAQPVASAQSLRPEPVVSTPQPVSTSSLPPPVAVQEPPSVAHDAATSTPRTRESSAVSGVAPSSTLSPETPVKSGQQQTPYSTAPSTPANAAAAASTTIGGGKKSAGQEALGQGNAGPARPQQHERTASTASAVEGKKKEGRRASGFFSRLFGGDKKKQQE